MADEVLKEVRTHPAWAQFAALLDAGDPVDNDTAEQFWLFFHEGWHVRGGLDKRGTAFARQEGGSHYDMPIQPMEFCHRNRLGACESHAIPYIVRHAEKGGREDIKKAIHCLELLLDMDYPEDPTDADDE